MTVLAGPVDAAVADAVDWKLLNTLSHDPFCNECAAPALQELLRNGLTLCGDTRTVGPVL